VEPGAAICDRLRVAEGRRRPEHGGEAATRRGFRLGVGAGSAIAKVVAAAILSALLVFAIAQHWPWYFLLVIGVPWALVFAGLVVVPMIASFVADTLSQHGRAGPLRTRATGPERSDAWGEAQHPLRRASDIGLHVAPTKGMMARPPVARTATGFDWIGLMQGVATRLEDALGEGFKAEAEDGTSIMLRHGDDMSRKVNLRLIFQPPPLDVSERAMRGCLKMMDEAQMFAMRVHHEPWPSRGGTRDTGPGNLPRPQVRLDRGQISMSWADSWGTMLRLRPLPFDSAPSEPNDDAEPKW
jgi:hypothetical protein